MKPTFTITEGEDPNYYNKYQDFLELYNNTKTPTKEIHTILDISQNQYRNYRKRAIEENQLQNRRQTHGKYYYKNGNGYEVKKYNGRKQIHYGYYHTIEQAQHVVKRLKEENWNIKKLPEIQMELHQ